MTDRATAPGKMMLSGEYAVLDGAPAIVAAVQRRAEVRVVEVGHDGPIARGLAHPEPCFPEVDATRRLAERELGITLDAELTVDVSQLRGETVKLGLGSSAAAAAATAALMVARAGVDADPATLFDLAIRGHEEVAPQGSGADVASAVYGELIRYVAPTKTVRAVSWPNGLIASVVFTGQAASTRELVAKVRELQARDEAQYDGCMGELLRVADVLADAFEAGEAARIIGATDEYGRAMAALGHAANAPIVEERLEAIAWMAREAGGAAKPSGAGGGDVAIAFFGSGEEAHRFGHMCSDAGFEVLDVVLGGPGATAG